LAQADAPFFPSVLFSFFFLIHGRVWRWKGSPGRSGALFLGQILFPPPLFGSIVVSRIARLSRAGPGRPPSPPLLRFSFLLVSAGASRRCKKEKGQRWQQSPSLFFSWLSFFPFFSRHRPGRSPRSRKKAGGTAAAFPSSPLLFPSLGPSFLSLSWCREIKMKERISGCNGMSFPPFLPLSLGAVFVKGRGGGSCRILLCFLLSPSFPVARFLPFLVFSRSECRAG